MGALYIRKGVRIESYLHGGGQEFGRRAGTESVLHVVGLGAAAEVAHREAAATRAHMAAMRDRIKDRLAEAVPQVDVCARVCVCVCVCVMGGV